MKKEKTWQFKEQNKSLRGDPGCPAGWPTHLRRHGGPKHNTAHKNLQTINRNSRNPSLIWLAPQVVTSCLRTGYCRPQRRSWDFHFKWNNGQLHRSPKPKGRFFPFLSFFLFLFFIWQCLEVSRSSTAADSEVFCLNVCEQKWGLSEIPPVLVHMIQWEPCVPLGGLFFSCLFMLYTRGKDPATLTAEGLLLLIRQDNTLCRIPNSFNS